jgi:hypothetical protein
MRYTIFVRRTVYIAYAVFIIAAASVATGQAQSNSRKPPAPPAVAVPLTPDEKQYNALVDQLTALRGEMERLDRLIVAKIDAKQNPAAEKVRYSQLQTNRARLQKQWKDLQDRIAVARAQAAVKGQPTSKHNGNKYVEK